MLAGEIAALSKLRTRLAYQIGGFESEGEVLEIARDHLPILQAFDAPLFDELMGIAEGSGQSPEQVVVLNHYTDLRDLAGRAREAAGIEPDGCTALWSMSQAGSVLAQTWDMHASALPFVMMMHIPAGEYPEAWLLSLSGCLGMAGANAAGLGVAINNLRSLDGRVGVVWPALVRRLMRESCVADAKRELDSAPIGSGHHYLVSDSKSAIGVESSGRKKKVIFESEQGSYLHTNHCLDSEIAACTEVATGSTSLDRYGWLKKNMEGESVRDVHDAFARLSSVEGWPRSVCTYMANAEQPHGMATCATLAIDLAAPAIYAVAGFGHASRPLRFGFGDEAAKES